jgi:hypothetical protein
MKRCFLILASILASGCSAWTQAQIDLVTQVRRGVTIVRQSESQRDQLVGELYKLRRQRLDDAFDQDVHARASLDANWVIEARRAYAAALDAFAKARAQNDRANDLRQQNLAAIDGALARLQYLQSIQLKYSDLEGKP